MRGEKGKKEKGRKKKKGKISSRDTKGNRRGETWAEHFTHEQIKGGDSTY